MGDQNIWNRSTKQTLGVNGAHNRLKGLARPSAPQKWRKRWTQSLFRYYP